MRCTTLTARLHARQTTRLCWNGHQINSPPYERIHVTRQRDSLKNKGGLCWGGHWTGITCSIWEGAPQRMLAKWIVAHLRACRNKCIHACLQLCRHTDFVEFLNSLTFGLNGCKTWVKHFLFKTYCGAEFYLCKQHRWENKPHLMCVIFQLHNNAKEEKFNDPMAPSAGQLK